MNVKQALDVLIAYALCAIDSEKTDLHCSDCPRYKPTDDEENLDTCKSWTEEEVGEAIRLLKTVKVLEPNHADPEVYVPIRKPIEAPEGPPIVKPIPSSEDILPKKVLGDYSPLSFTAQRVIRYPKEIAIIKICGATEIHITEDTVGFIKPTPEQIKNLKEMLCIDVELLEEEI